MPVHPFAAFSTMRSRFKSMSAPARPDHHKENISLLAGNRPTRRWEVISQSIRPQFCHRSAVMSRLKVLACR
jgi:hypothetical protein